MNIPKFDSYVCAGDSVTFDHEGFTITVHVHYDPDTTPDCDEGLNKEAAASWRRDEWWYGFIEVRASKRGIVLGRQYLGGYEVNFPGGTNDHLTQAVVENCMVEDAIQEAKDTIKELTQ